MSSFGSVRGSSNRFFTLIEMLVVIAIISILASMLSPMLMKALRTSRGVACTNNLKQIGVYAMTYADDNNNILLHNGGEWSSGLHSYSYLSNNRWFAKSTQWNRTASSGTLFHCPESVDAVTPYTSDAWNYEAFTCNYGLNRNLGGGIPSKFYSDSGCNYIPRTTLLTGTKFWFGDAGGEYRSNGAFAFCSVLMFFRQRNYDLTGRYTSLPFRYPEVQHHPFNSSNFLYGDCSAKSMSYTQYLTMTAEEADRIGGEP